MKEAIKTFLGNTAVGTFLGLFLGILFFYVIGHFSGIESHQKKLTEQGYGEYYINDKNEKDWRPYCKDVE
jgi:hypothetical protein